MTVTASPGINLSAYQSRAQRMLSEHPELVLGSILWFSITEGEDSNVSVPVRVSPDQLERWFEELDLDKTYLPPRLTKGNAFKKASSEIKHEYRIDETTVASLRTIEISKTTETIIRHVLRDITYTDPQTEETTTTTAHVVTLRFFRGARDANGQRYTSQFYKSAVLDNLVEVGLDNRATGNTYPLPDRDRVQVEAALVQFESRYQILSNTLQSQALRGMLRRYLASLNSLMVKKSGGVYFVLPDHNDTVRNLQELLRRIGQGCSMTLVALLDDPEQRDMLTDALAREIDVDCRQLLASIAEINAESENGKIPTRLYANTNATYQSIVDRAEEYTEKLGIAQQKAGASLELALLGLADLSMRIDPKLDKTKSKSKS